MHKGLSTYKVNISAGFQGAPETLRPLLAQIHAPLLSALAVACVQDRGLAIAPQQSLLFVGVLLPSPGCCKAGVSNVVTCRCLSRGNRCLIGIVMSYQKYDNHNGLATFGTKL